MIPRSSRLALCAVALLLAVSLYTKGRAPAAKGEGAAFLRAGSGGVKVRLSGAFPRPGLYIFPDGTPLTTAIKMTASKAAAAGSFGAQEGAVLHPGDVVDLRMGEGKHPVVTLGKMGVKERMLLGIALDPDLLTAQEWDALPGIGPVLSQRIVADRHKNGAFLTLAGVGRVPGMGPGKIAALEKFF